MERRLCRLAAAALAAAAICAAGPAFGAQSARVIFDGVLLGAVSQKGWIDAETLQEVPVADAKGNKGAHPDRIWGGHDARAFSQSAEIGECVITAPDGDHGDKKPIPGLITVGAQAPGGKGYGIGSAILVTDAPGVVRPRAFKPLPAGNAVYEGVVSKWLAGKGLKVSKPRIVQLFRGDLDGDGTDEVLVTAASPDFSRCDWSADKPLSPDGTSAYEEKKGAYCVTLLRAVAGNSVKEIVLSEWIGRNDANPASEKWSPPFLMKFYQAADLDGDGAMELITGWRSYEGIGYQVWNYRRGKAGVAVESSFTP